VPITFEQLCAVNSEVNAIPYDAALGEREPVDWWTDNPDAEGSYVCRDYVLTKSKRLRELGWPVSSLSVVLCWTEPPESVYHAVLAVDVNGETWILDNRVAAPYRWDRAPYHYRWDRRQVPGTVEFKSLATEI